MQSNLDFWKKFFLKNFIVSYALTLTAFVIWLFAKDFCFSIAHQLLEIDKTVYNQMVMDFFTVGKLIMFYVFLTPAITLYWMAHRQKADWRKNIKLDEED